ncbi:hypothetical protein Bresa_02906|nr:hypothetical protein [Brenneria salicis ATCC 15712 = DSM 30166]
MKVDDTVENITKFFNDLIGALVPGSVFAFGVIVIHLGLNYMCSLANLGEKTSVSLICAGLLFALGHMLLAVYDNLMKPFFQLVKLSKRFDEVEAQRRQSYLWFADLNNCAYYRSTFVSPGLLPGKGDAVLINCLTFFSNSHIVLQ